MKGSLRKQIVTVFMGLVAAIMIISIVINSLFLSRYYIRYKESELTDVYDAMQRAVRESPDPYNDMTEDLSSVLEAGNIMFVIMTDDANDLVAATSGEAQIEEMRSQLLGYIYQINQRHGELLKEKENYQIRRTRSVLSGEEYVEMWGYLDDASPFIIRTPLESIQESVKLSNRFFFCTMVIILVVGGVFVWYFSKRITSPVQELVDISRRMTDLDFEARYTSGGTNEIGILGKNFNIMSDRLQKTVCELKNANSKLQEDIEKREEAEAGRSEFIGNVSHELKTPIALIQGYAEGLKEGVTDDEEGRRFYLDVIIDEAEKMNKTVQNLLTLTQLESGGTGDELERFDVTEMIKGIVESSRILTEQKGVSVRVSESGPVYVWADEWKAEQVFRNYFVNAINHADGEKVIDVKVIENDEKGTVRVSVFNTGSQIPKEDLDRIWGKFYKVDKARTREYGGNGIGLSIVKAIMESAHKDYGVQNYDNGVMFWFELDKFKAE